MSTRKRTTKTPWWKLTIKQRTRVLGYVLIAATLLQTETFAIHPYVTWAARFITAFAAYAGADIAWDALHHPSPSQAEWDDGKKPIIPPTSSPEL